MKTKKILLIVFLFGSIKAHIAAAFFNEILILKSGLISDIIYFDAHIKAPKMLPGGKGIIHSYGKIMIYHDSSYLPRSGMTCYKETKGFGRVFALKEIRDSYENFKKNQRNRWLGKSQERNFQEVIDNTRNYSNETLVFLFNNIVIEAMS